jgi:hypothetical protein
MKRFSLAILTSLLLSSPVAAFTVDMQLPNLTFPAPAPEPSRACTTPGQLATAGCAVTE